MDQRLKKIIDGFADSVSGALGDRLVSVIVYGSAAADGYVPGRSDVNFLLVVDKAGPEVLEALVGPVSKWRKKGVAMPLVMDRDDVGNSLDSYPLEFLDMKAAHLVVMGEDVPAGIVIAKDDLRLQCEREIRGGIIKLQRGFLEAGGKGLDGLFRESIKSFVVIMRSMIWLEGVDPLPGPGSEVIAAVEQKLSRQLPHCRKALEYRAGKPKLAKPEVRRLFDGYLQEIRDLSAWIDGWGGESS